jgi:hypothetical protein
MPEVPEGGTVSYSVSLRDDTDLDPSISKAMRWLVGGPHGLVGWFVDEATAKYVAAMLNGAAEPTTKQLGLFGEG